MKHEILDFITENDDYRKDDNGKMVVITFKIGMTVPGSLRRGPRGSYVISTVMRMTEKDPPSKIDQFFEAEEVAMIAAHPIEPKLVTPSASDILKFRG